jgi:hypothetical protein
MNDTPSTGTNISNRQHVIAALLFVLLATALINKALLPGYVLLPIDLVKTIKPWTTNEPVKLANELLSDPFYSFYPRRHLITTALQNGQLPLWNPYIMTGTPEVANPNFQMFYPLSLAAALILPADRALSWLAWLHLIITGWLMYLFLRRQRLAWLASVIGAAMWMLNGYTLVWLENPHRLSTAAWFPGLFWAYEAATQDRKIGWAALAGVFLGLSILAGQAQFIFGIGLIFGLYGLIKWLAAMRATRSWSLSNLRYMIVAGTIGLGLGALMLLPAAEFASVSQRLRFNAETVQATAWPLDHLVTLFAPDVYGNPTGPVNYRGTANYAETTAYFGAAGLALAVSSLIVARKSVFKTQAAALALCVLAISLGTPLIRLLFWLPGAEFVPLGRTIFLVPLVGVWLVALGVDGWLTQPLSRRRRLVAIGAVVVSVLAVAVLTWPVLSEFGPIRRGAALTDFGRGALLIGLTGVAALALSRWPRAAGTALLLLTIGDLLEWGLPFNPIISTGDLYPDNEITQWLTQDTSLFRVMPLQKGTMIFGPNVLSIFGLQEMGGYTPLITRQYHRLFWSIDNTSQIEWMRPGGNMLIANRYHPIYDLFNVKYVLSNTDLSLDTLPDVAQAACVQPVTVTGTITQSLAAQQAGLNRLDVYIASVAPTVSGELTFELHRADNTAERLALASVPLAELAAKTYQSFYFAPVTDSGGQSFEWSVTAPGGVAVCRLERPLGSAAGDLAFAAFATSLQLRHQADGVRIYENMNAMPRAFVVQHVEQVAPDRITARLLDPTFDWRHSILLPDLPLEYSARLSAIPRHTPSQAVVTDYQLNRVSVDVQAAADGLLVLTDAYYSGWQATVDDVPATIFAADGVFRAVWIPTGAHHVEFRFEPASLRWSLLITAIALIVAIVLMLMPIARRRTHHAIYKEHNL